MKLYSGIDLHSNNHYICLIDKDDNRLLEKRLGNDLSETLNTLKPHQKHIASIAIESTYNWYWLADGLMAAGYDVKLVNTVALQHYSGLKHTDDKSDAFWLAHVLRLGLLPTGYICPPKLRGIRDLLRKRLQLVEDRTRHLLRVQSQISRSTGKSISISQLKKGEALPAKLITDSNILYGISADRSCIDLLNSEITSIEERVLAQCRLKPTFKRLTSVYGIGTILGMTIMLETGDIHRFASAANFSSYCRCVTSARYSNGKKKGVNNRKNGNRHLARAFVEAAYFAARFYDKPRLFMERKTRQVNRALATKALAHKLAKACYYIMRDQVMFDPDKLFT